MTKPKKQPSGKSNSNKYLEICAQAITAINERTASPVQLPAYIHSLTYGRDKVTGHPGFKVMLVIDGLPFECEVGTTFKVDVTQSLKDALKPLRDKFQAEIGFTSRRVLRRV